MIMDNLTAGQRRRNMQNIRSKDTLPELKLEQELKNRRLHFARHVKSLPGKPDFVFRRKKVAVFVDSDFWHGHSSRGVMPKSNRGYWKEKIRRNKKRDKVVTAELKNQGWVVVRIWEHNLNKHYRRTINKILKEIKKASKSPAKKVIKKRQ